MPQVLQARTGEWREGERVPYRWLRAGDLNAFFGLALDNLSNLVILWGILVGLFGFPQDVVLYRMIPGTALGVLVGDLIYTWMAFRLARRTGRDDVTAMPLGIDTPSLFGLSFGVLGPAYLATKNAELAWKVGMAVLVLMGIAKILGAFAGEGIRRVVPRAGLLGSIAGVAILLIAFLPGLKVFADPVVGFLALGVILLTLIAQIPPPLRLPGALVAVLLGTGAAWAMGWLGLPRPAAGNALPAAFRVALPLPSLDFRDGLGMAWGFLPVALPFAVATLVGGIDVTESAAAAGDAYRTRDILLTEGVATLVAGLCGGAIQNTPYIGHPAYKAMGGRAGYTLATALFIGLGGMLGFLSYLVGALPEAAVAPILIFIGIEIVAQAFQATPARHAKAVAVAFLPSIANLLLIQTNAILGAFRRTGADLPGDLAGRYQTITRLGNGFILSALLWGAATAFLIDRRLPAAALAFGLGGAATLFGIIHSPLENGGLFLPWRLERNAPVLGLAGGYLLLAALVGLLGLARRPAGAMEPGR